MSRIVLVDPRGTPVAPGRRLAPRPATIGPGARIGFLANEAEHVAGAHFAAYTRALERTFRERLAVEAFHHATKPVLSRPAEPALLDGFRGCAGAVNGLAK